MTEVLLIESVGGGQTKELQEMEFDPLPGKGDFITISMGSMTAKFEVEAIIHKVALGRKNKVIIRVRNVEGQPQQQQQRYLPRQQPQNQPRALPPAVIDVVPAFDDEEPFYNT